jgi:hypothetical protein
VPSFIKKEPKDGTITESSKKILRKEIRYYYSTPKSSYSVKENSKANGKDRTPSSTCHHCWHFLASLPRADTGSTLSSGARNVGWYF